MAPRFMQRMNRQSAILQQVFGEPAFDPPPYPDSFSTATSSRTSSTLPKRRTYSPYRKPLPTPPPRYTVGDSPPPPVIEDFALPLDSLVLVTDANGLQGSHVVDQLLAHGFRVRGIVRTAEKAIWTAQVIRERYGAGRYTTAVIPDMLRKGAFEIALRGCAGVIYCASVVSFSSDHNAVITLSIDGALNAMEAAAKEPQVRRFVYCSAMAAEVAHGSTKVKRENAVTSESWNLASLEEAWAPPSYEAETARDVFAVSKMQPEQTVWRWYRERRPHFTLNTAAILRSIVDGNAAEHFTDPLDSALLLLATLLLPNLTSQWIFATAAPYNTTSFLKTLQNMLPERELPGVVSDHRVDLTVFREGPRAKRC